MLWRLVVDILYYFTFIFFCMAPAAAIPEPTVKPVLGAPGATKTSNKLIWWCSLCIVRFYFLWFPLLRLQHKHQQQKLEKGSVQNCFLLLWKKLNFSVISAASHLHLKNLSLIRINHQSIRGAAQNLAKKRKRRTECHGDDIEGIQEVPRSTQKDSLF